MTYTGNLSVVAVMMLLVSLGSAVYLDSYGAIDGTATVSPPSSLVGWWEFDSSQSGARDSSIYDRHGALMDGAKKTAQGYLNLTSQDSYVGAPLSLAGEEALTVAYWAKLDNQNYDNDERIFSSGGVGQDQELLWPNNQEGDRGLSWIVWDGSSSGRIDSSLSPLGWVHVTGTWNGTRMKLYSNGQQIGAKSFAGDGTIGDSGDYIYIGKDLDTAKPGFKGLVDDVRVYNVSLTGPQVQNLHDQTCGDYGAC